MRRILQGAVAALCLGAVFSAAPARAQFTLTFAPTPTSVTLGQQIGILATLTNSSGFDLTNFGFAANVTAISGNASGLTFDDTNFALNLPDPLSNTTSFSGSIFIQAGSNATPGTYNLNYQLTANDGGTNPFTASATRPFTVVAPATSAAPEASTLALVAVAGLPLAGMVRRRLRGA